MTTAIVERNWRVDPETEWGQHFRDTEGNWFFPDCCYQCTACGECLGCVRKRVWDWIDEDNQDSKMFLKSFAEDVRCSVTGHDHVFDPAEHKRKCEESDERTRRENL